MAESAPDHAEWYIAELLEIQQFLTTLSPLLAESASEADSDDYVFNQFADEYLEALRMKEQQLKGMRTFVRQNQRRGRNSDPSSDLIGTILDDVEPKCREVIEALSKMKAGQTKKKRKPFPSPPDNRDTVHAADLTTSLTPPLAANNSATADDDAVSHDDAGQNDLPVQTNDIEEAVAQSQDNQQAMLGDSSGQVQDVGQVRADMTVGGTEVQDAQKVTAPMSTVQPDTQPPLTAAAVDVDSGRASNDQPVGQHKQTSTDNSAAEIKATLPSQPVEPTKPLHADHTPAAVGDMNADSLEETSIEETFTELRLDEMTEPPPEDWNWLEIIQSPGNGEPLENWMEGVNRTSTGGQTKWVIDREARDFLETAFDKYKTSKDRELRRDLMVEFRGMPGIDRGALTREFFYFAFETVISGKCKDVSMMVGTRGHLLPDPTAEHLIDAYKYLGMMIAHAVKCGCHGFPGLSPAVKHFLIHGGRLSFIENHTPPLTVHDVADEGLRRLLHKLDAGLNLTDADRDLLQTWMERSDCRIALNAGTRMLIVQNLLLYYVLKSRIVQLEAIAAGMEMFDFIQFLRANPLKETLEIVFPTADATEITPKMFMSAIISRGDEFHAESFLFLEQFVNELHDGGVTDRKISDLLIYLSGSPYLPPRIVMSFNNKASLPVSHSCFNEIVLPTVHNQYRDFRNAMLVALQHGMDYSMDADHQGGIPDTGQ